MAELGFNGEDTIVADKERDGGLEEAEDCRSGDWRKEEGGGSAERVVGDSWEDVGDSWERAGEEPLGVGAGVVVLDGSRETISKGFVFTWDDGSIVRRGEGGEGAEKGGGERRREGEGEREREGGDGMSLTPREGKNPDMK